MLVVGRPRRVPLVSQGGLLLVLLGHLLLMASPLHAETVHREAGVAAHQEAHHDHCPACVGPQLASADTAELGGDCAFEPALRPASAPFRLGTCHVLVAWQDALQHPGAWSSWLLERERPLRLAPTQAFLQVFRT
jgi:hypothetical protein